MQEKLRRLRHSNIFWFIVEAVAAAWYGPKLEHWIEPLGDTLFTKVIVFLFDPPWGFFVLFILLLVGANKFLTKSESKFPAWLLATGFLVLIIMALALISYAPEIVDWVSPIAVETQTTLPTNGPTSTPDLESQAQDFVELYFERVEAGELETAWRMLTPVLQFTLGETEWFLYWRGNDFLVSNIETSFKGRVAWVTMKITVTNKETLKQTEFPNSNFCVYYNLPTRTWLIRDLFFEEHACW